MSDAKDPKPGIVHRMRRWVGGFLVSDVPHEVAACEFECREHECSHGQWETCENRRLAGNTGNTGKE